MKRILAFAFVLVLVLSLCSVSVFADGVTLNALFMKQAGYSEDDVTAMTQAFTEATGIQVNPTFVAYEEAGGDDGEAWVLAVGGQFAQFLLGEQEFAVTLGFMIVVGSECVLGYVHALYPQFSVYECAVTVGQAGF